MEQKTTGKAFYDQQVAYLEAGDVDGLLSQYHEDALIVGFEFSVRGREAIRQHMSEYLARLGQLRLKSTDKFAETEDTILFEATMTTNMGEARVYDAFVLRDGKASYQFTGVISVDPAGMLEHPAVRMGA